MQPFSSVAVTIYQPLSSGVTYGFWQLVHESPELGLHIIVSISAVVSVNIVVQMNWFVTEFAMILI